MSDNSIQAPSPEHLGKLLPQYGIESLIAQGGMGAVYKGRQLSLDRDVAIKVLLYEFGEDLEFRESFTTEAKAMARLNHPNLLGVFDFGDVDGMPYIVMEYVDGGSLYEATWNKVVDPLQAVSIVKGICDGLDHAHGHNIVHRDIKPSNILLTPRAEPKVADFGLAHATDSDKIGLVMGTPGYTAPEVFQNPDQAGKLADIYSVGVILHQLLTGIDPAGSQQPPSQVSGHPRLDLIWRKATHSTPALRYPSVAAMTSDLENWIASQKNVPVATGRAAPKRPLAPRLRVKSSTRSGGGGILVKLLLLGILAAAATFTYQHLQEQKKASHRNKETGTVATPDPTPVPDKPPKPRPPERLETPAPPDPGPTEIGKDEEPVVPTVMDSRPEPEPKLDLNLPPGDPELHQRAIVLITDARKKHDKELAENARALISQLSSRARSYKRDQAAFIERLKGDAIENRVPRTDNIHGLPDELVRDFEQARSKEGTIDTTYGSELKRIRDAYLPRLEKAAAQTPDAELKRRLLSQAEPAKNLDSWVQLLAPESTSISRRSSGSVVGNWDNRSYNSESRWVAHRDGRMEIVGETWTATWKILEDGTLQVDWGKNAPYTYTRDGDGWTGKNPHGGEATLTRGNW